MPLPPLFVRLTGTQEAMGAQHGTLAAGDAARLFAFYSTMPERSLVGDLRGPAGIAGRWLVRKLASAMQGRLAATRPPELQARTRAFVAAVRAQGVGPIPHQPERTIAAMDSLQNCVALVARRGLGPFARPVAARVQRAAVPACSTVIAWDGATPDGELLFGRNFDFPGVGVWDAAPSFVVCAPDRGQAYAFFSTRGADAPGITVVNEAGLVMAPHTRWHRDVAWSGAMIIDLVHSIARRAETLADAVAIARERPVSSSWGLAIGSARERSALVLEIAGPTVEVVRPTAGSPTLVCTNRYRTPSLQVNEFAGSTAWAESSERRERRLRALIDARIAPLTARDIAGFLGDRHESGRGPRRRLGGVVANPANVHCAVVAPAHRRAWMGIDQAPCCEGAWSEVAWTWQGPAGGWELDAPALAAAGFSATRVPDFVAPQDAATRHVADAVRAYESTHDARAASAALELAVAADSTDPSLRLGAAWLALEIDEPARAVAHVEAGLATERDDLRRGQLLLWGARAATRARSFALASRWTHELAGMTSPEVSELQAAAHRPFRGRPHVNLLMADAY